MVCTRKRGWSSLPFLLLLGVAEDERPERKDCGGYIGCPKRRDDERFGLTSPPSKPAPRSLLLHSCVCVPRRLTCGMSDIGAVQTVRNVCTTNSLSVWTSRLVNNQALTHRRAEGVTTAEGNGCVVEVAAYATSEGFVKGAETWSSGVVGEIGRAHV